MATVYILHSAASDKFYIGSCEDLDLRLKQHQDKAFDSSFTRVADDWIVYYTIDDLSYQQARQIESHIKRMKSRKYLRDLKLYPEISGRLREKYL